LKAAFNGNIKCVELLLREMKATGDLKSLINHPDKEQTTPLHNAVYNGHLEVVKALLIHQATPDCQTGKYKSTPLHFAAFNGYLDCIKVLLSTLTTLSRFLSNQDPS
jgi:ankyrin repeat protein